MSVGGEQLETKTLGEIGFSPKRVGEWSACEPATADAEG